ncbi:hypothetical protein M413DRAFT_289670 [Hebeloma cylindrosporum]|uniref:Uncharacterized protein n=1 Tax=Hebeloma cylindrosporum TaxID=76867 RepID=A0A0C2XEP9_HEBCY|nr:hypothetical protein M413DRAFT_289670 [Hebeloma cylindrosporum h7]
MPAEYFNNNRGSHVSGGEFSAPADSNAKFFSDGKGLKITGGIFGISRTDTGQSTASRSSSLAQDGSDGDSHPVRQGTGKGKTKARQDDSLYPSGRDRKGSDASILAGPHQVTNDPESYDTIQPMQGPPASHASSALRTNTAPSSNKGDGGYNHHSHAKAHAAVSSAPRTNTAPASSKRNDSTTQSGGFKHPPPPPPLPPKPEEYRQERSQTGGSMGHIPDATHGGSNTYPRPPYPSPLTTPPRGGPFFNSPPESPEVLRQGYRFSPVEQAFPQTPQHQSYNPELAYPSPGSPGYGSHPPPPPPEGLGQMGYPQGTFPPHAPSTPTRNPRSRHPQPPAVDMMQWSQSDSQIPSSHTPIPQPMNRAVTMPTPYHSSYGPPMVATPPGGQHHRPTYDGSQYDAYRAYPHHSGHPQPLNYTSAQDNHYGGPPAPSQDQAPSFPVATHHP